MRVPPSSPRSLLNLAPLIPLVILSLILGGAAACGKGCLRCGAGGACEQCDTSSFFVLRNATCVLGPIVGCNSTDLGGSCLDCNNNFFLYNGSCFPVSAPVAHCAQYLSATACLSCVKGYLLAGGVCQVQRTIIQYCDTYTPDGTVCTGCIANHVLTFDGLGCVPAVPVPGCQSYTNLRCMQCSDGFILDRSAYGALVGLISNSSSDVHRQVLTDLVRITNRNETTSFFPTCLSIRVANCKVPLDSAACQTCNPNFYLDQTLQCQPYPTTAIPFCAVYLNNVTCSACLQGHYLAATGDCLQVAQIPNCANYSTVANNVCLECLPSHYSTLTDCVARTASLNVTNCVLKDGFTDKCANCTPTFTPSTDGATCVAAIPNCATYTKTALAITCAACVQNYFLDGAGNCVLSSAKNCRVVSGLTTCSECNQGSYKGPGDVCLNHTLTSLQSCNTTSITQLNGCTACDPTKILATIDGMCMPVATTLSSCLVYQTPTTCLTCDPAVSYRLNGVCFSTYLPNCLLYHPTLVTSCAQCVVDAASNTIFVAFPARAANNRCVPGNPNVAQSCQVPTNANNVEGCAQCAPSFYPVSFTSANNAFCVPRTFYLLAGQAVAMVNCLFFNHLAQACVVCAPGLVIDLTGACVTQCPANSYLYAFSFNTTNATDVSLVGRLKCATTAPNNAAMNFNPSPFPCYFVAAGTAGSGQFCGGCAAGQIGVIDLEVTQVNTVTTSLWPIGGLVSFTNYNSVPSVQGCVSTTVTLTGSTSQVATLAARAAANTPMTFDNCRFALKVGTRYGCGACRFGFSGLPVADFDNSGYFIQSCQAVQSCQPTVYFGGLGSLPGQTSIGSPPLEFFVSCHFCQVGLIPTYAAADAAVSSVTPPIGAGFYGPYGVPAAADTLPPATNKKTAGPVTSCRPPGFGQAFIPFCGVQYLKINVRIAPFSADLKAANNPLCQACLPGYSPAFINTTTVIASCNVIANCNFNVAKKFNLCGQCISNFALAYDANAPDNLSQYQECVGVANSDFNCIYAVKATGACVVCKPGFFLNADSFCDALNTWDCQVPGLMSPFRLGPFRTLAPAGTGCQQCSDSSILIRFPAPFPLCAQSVLIVSNIPIPANSHFLIERCLNFGLNPNGSVVCFRCALGFLPTVANTLCVAIAPPLANCLVVNNDGLTCFSCVNGFYSSGGRCVQGSNPNCQAYVPGQANSCLNCAPGFTAVPISNAMSVCLKNPDINCAAFAARSAVPGQISCTQCQTGFFYEIRAAVLGANPLPICLDVPPIPNCVRYQNAGTVLTANMACLQCSAKFFVSSLLCVLRTNMVIPNCATLDPMADACQTCAPGFWLDSAKTCQPFPTGISGCLVYKSAIACESCNARMFLSSNKCLPVPGSSLVANCLHYDSSLNCQTCAPGFFRQTPTSCVAVKATNCLTLRDADNCATCQPNFGLSRSAASTNCVAINIPNCITPDYSTLAPNFRCLVCQTSFYLNPTGGCTAVPSTILFCYLYSSATTCSTCFTGHVLSPLNTTCVINNHLRNVMDLNCQFTALLANPVCNACRPGHAMKTNPDGTVACLACDPSNPFCLVCDSKDTTKCLACVAGYSQSVSGVCNKTFQAVRKFDSANRLLISALVGLTWATATLL